MKLSRILHKLHFLRFCRVTDLNGVVLKENTQISAWLVFIVFLRLGCTAFGGPVAHLSYFQQELVDRRRWFDHQSYMGLVTLCQLLPGPSSSQVGMAVGYQCAGFRGACAAWLGFTVPAALLLTLCAVGFNQVADLFTPLTLAALKLITAAVVAQAVVNMARSLCPDWSRKILLLAAAAVVWLLPSSWTAILVLVVAGLITAVFSSIQPVFSTQLEMRQPAARMAFVLCFLALLLLLILPVMAWLLPGTLWGLLDRVYSAGAWVFGGGHVVLPLLQSAVVDTGWVDQERFLSGYALTQAMPGPLFAFAAFLGASLPPAYNPWLGAGLALLVLFLPSTLLLFGVLPFYRRWQNNLYIRRALLGANAAVVGVLLAALLNPVLSSAVHTWHDVVYAGLAYLSLQWLRVPAWLLVLLAIILGWWLGS